MRVFLQHLDAVRGSGVGGKWSILSGYGSVVRGWECVYSSSTLKRFGVGGYSSGVGG